MYEEQVVYNQCPFITYLPIVPPVYVMMNKVPTFSFADLITIALMQGNCTSVTKTTNGNGNGIYIPHFLYDIFKCGLHEQG